MNKFITYEENGKQVIERLAFPRFKCEITMESDIENIEIFDNINPMELAKAMRATAEYMRKGHKKKN